jgi:hypothetical protein
MDRSKQPTRRAAMQNLIIGAFATLAVKPACAESDEPKLTKQQAGYQDQPQDIRCCATCSLFVAPNACKRVEGEVSPDGWCKLFDIAD